jgi:S-adenosylmethionine decarboxylase
MMRALGTQLLIDLWQVAKDLLDDPAHLEQVLTSAAQAGGATVADSRFHRFAPQGVSGVLILAESHLAVHTWPELGYAAADVFTCGAPEIADRVATAVITAMAPGEHTIHRCVRGLSPQETSWKAMA